MYSPGRLFLHSQLNPEQYALLRAATDKELQDFMLGETKKLMELRKSLVEEMEMITEEVICTKYRETENFLDKIKIMKNSYQDEIEDFVEKYSELVDDCELLDQWNQEVTDIAVAVKNNVKRIRIRAQDVADAATKKIKSVPVPFSKRDIARLYQDIADYFTAYPNHAFSASEIIEENSEEFEDKNDKDDAKLSKLSNLFPWSPSVNQKIVASTWLKGTRKNPHMIGKQVKNINLGEDAFHDSDLQPKHKMGNIAQVHSFLDVAPEEDPKDDTDNVQVPTPAVSVPVCLKTDPEPAAVKTGKTTPDSMVKANLAFASAETSLALIEPDLELYKEVAQSDYSEKYCGLEVLNVGECTYSKVQ